MGNEPDKRQPKQIILMVCPRCKEPIVTTTDGVYCPKCGYKRLKDK